MTGDRRAKDHSLRRSAAPAAAAKHPNELIADAGGHMSDGERAEHEYARPAYCDLVDAGQVGLPLHDLQMRQPMDLASRVERAPLDIEIVAAIALDLCLPGRLGEVQVRAEHVEVALWK